MRKPTRPREIARGERILPGVWRLRLPLDIAGVPHCNAWALAAGDGIVLVDTGRHEAGSMADLERALAAAGRRVEDVRLVVITHAHTDHCGQAPAIAARVGCEVWIHPQWRLHAPAAADPAELLDRRIEGARRSGVPEAQLRRWAERLRGEGTGRAGTLRSDRDLVAGVEVVTDIGTWQVVHTPGHAPSHVCLHLPERRVLISGDHVLGRVSQYFDVGFTPDPVGEFLHSLDVVGPPSRAACALRPRASVHRRRAPHRRQPRARGAPARARPRRARRRPADGVRGRARRLWRALAPATWRAG